MQPDRRSLSFDFRLYYVQNRCRAREPRHNLANGDQLNILNFKYNTNRIATMWDFMVGPRWETWFSNNRYYVSLTAGWELLHATGAMIGFVTASGADNGFGIAIQGLTLSGLFEF